MSLILPDSADVTLNNITKPIHTRSWLRGIMHNSQHEESIVMSQNLCVKTTNCMVFFIVNGNMVNLEKIKERTLIFIHNDLLPTSSKLLNHQLIYMVGVKPPSS
jgi:hypothetical protein